MLICEAVFGVEFSLFVNEANGVVVLVCLFIIPKVRMLINVIDAAIAVIFNQGFIGEELCTFSVINEMTGSEMLLF